MKSSSKANRNSVMQHDIDADMPGAGSVHAADLDGDGDVDVVSASHRRDYVAWYESNGDTPPEWRKRVVARGFDDPYSVYAADLDGDGDVDVVGAAYEASKVTWWENDGGRPPAWTERDIATGFAGACSVYATDVDGDGDTDVLGTDLLGDHVAFWENDGGRPPSWTRHNIDDSFGGGYSVHAGDLDGDGDTDVVAATVLGHRIRWWENDGGTPPGRTGRTVIGFYGHASSVHAADLDGDGDVDIVCAGGADVDWWENDGGRPPGWTMHSIDPLWGGWSIFASDVDGDGDVDVVGDGYREIRWWENDGGRPPGWTEHKIAPDFDGANAVYATDLDGDCDVDVLGAAWGVHTVAWWENATSGFTVSCAEPVQSVGAGGAASFEVILTSYGGFDSPVTLSIEGLPAGAWAESVPRMLVSDGRAVVTIHTDATTPAGSYNLRVRASFDGECSRRTTVVLEVGTEDQEFVPEPGTAVLLAVGLSGLGGCACIPWARRRLRRVVRS